MEVDYSATEDFVGVSLYELLQPDDALQTEKQVDQQVQALDLKSNKAISEADSADDPDEDFSEHLSTGDLI